MWFGQLAALTVSAVIIVMTVGACVNNAIDRWYGIEENKK